MIAHLENEVARRMAEHADPALIAINEKDLREACDA